MTVPTFHVQQPGMTISVSASGSRPSQMPPWMSFFLQLGSEVADQATDQPTTAAVIAPAREFAGLVAAIGVIRARRTVQHVPLNQFEEVWASGQTLTIRFVISGKDKELRGRVVDRETRSGERYLRLQLSSKDSGMTLVPEHSINNLAILQEGSSRRARAAGITDPWLAKLLEGCDGQTYLLADRYDCLLVGRVNQLQDEAELGLHFIGQSGVRELLSGSLHCALRARAWQPTGTTFSSDVISDRSDPQEHAKDDLKRFHTVIFDGATAYLRWHDVLSGQHQLVLLQQADRRLEEAVNGLDQEFRLRSADWETTVDCPTGMELLSFRRRM